MSVALLSLFLLNDPGLLFWIKHLFDAAIVVDVIVVVVVVIVVVVVNPESKLFFI